MWEERSSREKSTFDDVEEHGGFLIFDVFFCIFVVFFGMRIFDVPFFLGGE